MLAAFFLASCVPSNVQLLSKWELPELQLHLTYLDIEGKRYAKCLRRRFQRIVQVRTGSDDLHDESLVVARGMLFVDDA
jgi:hypothetical protein